MIAAPTLATVCAVGIVVGACATTAPPVPLEGRPDAISALAGEWTGDYSSDATGRSGSIVFKLTAGRDTAQGDVVMIPAGSGEPLLRANEVGAAGMAGANVTRAQARGLTIRFVSVVNDSIGGVLDPYTAPECACVVTTRFSGRVTGDRIDGTFETSGEHADRGPQRGRWTVTRRRP